MTNGWCSMSEIAAPRPRRLGTSDLDALIDPPEELAAAKVVATLGAAARRFVAHSPFVCIASSSSAGADCSPRGDGPGFVTVLDDTTLALPDRSGNNLADTFRNVVEHSAIGMLFLIPGVSETLRVNGRGFVTDDPQVLGRFDPAGRPVRLALVMDVEEVYFHCGKSVLRSALWDDQRDLAAAATLGRNVFALENAERPRAGTNAQGLGELLRDGYADIVR